MTTTLNYGNTPDWKELYEAAVLELDRQRLSQRIEDARQAILRRLEDMDPGNQPDAEPLNNALQVLQDLHKIDAENGKTGAA